ncbi:MAG: type II secretion system F family protein [Planctomycetota bacterium]
MSWYEYDAISADGSACSGRILASSVGDAARQLERKSMQVVSIRKSIEDSSATKEEEQRDLTANDERPHWRNRLMKIIQDRTEWLTTLDEITVELPNNGVRREFERLTKKLKGDLALDDVLTKSEYGPLLPLLTSAQEESGASPGVGVRIQSLVLQARRKRDAWLTLSYPLALCVLSLAVVIAFAIFLIPVFREMFDEFGLNLPQPTRWVIFVSDLFTERWAQTVVGVLVGAGLVYVAQKWWRRYALTNRLLGSFVAGTASNLRAMSNVASSLAELLRLGAPLEDALVVAANHSNHAVYARVCRELAITIGQGIEVGNAGRSALRHLPRSLVFALQTAPEPNPKLLRELAKIYGDRASRRTDWLTTLLPTLSVLVVGFIVAFVVVALFLPLVTMVSSLA